MDGYNDPVPCITTCEEALEECINIGSLPPDCERSYHECIDECDRNILIEEFSWMHTVSFMTPNMSLGV